MRTLSGPALRSACLLAMWALGCGDDVPPGPAVPAPGDDSSVHPIDSDVPDTGEPEPPPTVLELEFQPIDLQLDTTTDFVFIEGAPDEMFVVTHPGVLHRLRVANGATELLESVNIPGVFYDEGCGILSLALDPDFTRNGYLYMGRCDDTRTSTLARYTYDDGLATLPQTESVIMRIVEDSDPDEDWHRWGSMGFEEDGETMWALLGDLFARENAQNIEDKAGSVLRFRPNRVEGGAGFEPADGNFNADGGLVDPSVYAYGFRSPFRGTRDRAGRFWVADVGLVTKEELNVVTQPGQNFGWDHSEGRCTTDCDQLQDPVVDWGRTGAEPFDAEDPNVVPSTKRAAWAGVVYEEPSVDRYYGLLTDRIIYGDFYTGWVRSLKTDASEDARDDRFVGHLTSVVSVRLGPDGYVYLLTLDGTLFQARIKGR